VELSVTDLPGNGPAWQRPSICCRSISTDAPPAPNLGFRLRNGALTGRGKKLTNRLALEFDGPAFGIRPLEVGNA